MSKARKPAANKKAANGYKLAAPLPEGEIIQAINKKKWIIGPPIGQGGFGTIYSAKDYDDKKNHWPYVIKIEPHENGPLFVEMHFYTKTYKSDAIEKFLKDRKLKSFGLPQFLGSGSHVANDEKYRFLVIEKLGLDVWKLYLENGRILPGDTVFKMAIQILDVLEFVHQSGYIHGDIKGANILIGSNNQQVYLVDFGLASKFYTGKEFKPNKKKAHNGTIEYLSRDAHDGVETRRGDLEILAYNMIQWLGCTLPWEKDLSKPETVQKSKQDHMKSPTTIVKACFGLTPCPNALMEYLKYLDSLDFNTEPDYKKIRAIFVKGVKEMNGSLTEPMRFASTSNGVTIKRRSSVKIGVPVKKGRLSVVSTPKKRLRARKVQPDVVKEPETKPVKKTTKKTTAEKNVTKRKVTKTETPAENGFEGYTASMIEVARKAAEKKSKMAKTEVKKAPGKKKIAAEAIGDVENSPEPSTSKQTTRKAPKKKSDEVPEENGVSRVKRVRKTKN